VNNLPPWLIIVLVPIVVLVLCLIAYFIYSLTQTTVTRKARVTGKQKSTGMSTARCTFEFEDGTSEEYDVSLDTYYSLAPGDVGELNTRGALFWGFRREGAGRPSSSPASESIPEGSLGQIKDALVRGQKVEAIRLYRECTGSRLVEAKAAVEALEAEMRAHEPRQFT
jgi:hypothetical protein